MKKNLLFILGATAILASCSNNDVVDQKEEVNIPFDGVVSLNAGSNISITQTRAVVSKWQDTPIRVWGLDNAGSGWNTASGNLFSPASYVDGKVATDGKVKLGGDNDVYFYPLNSDVNFSFYACSPIPTNPSLSSNNATVTYEVTGNKDILWGEAIAQDVDSADGKTYSGYNARYFRKGGLTPELKFKHLLTQLQLFGIGGDEGLLENGKVWPVSIKNITVTSQKTASLAVAGVNKGILTAVGANEEIPAYFGDNKYTTNVTLETKVEKDAGNVMLLPSTSGSYVLNVTLSAMVNGQERTQTNEVTITYKNAEGQISPFEAGKAYKVKLTIYGLRVVDINATLEEWKDADQTIDQEVN